MISTIILACVIGYSLMLFGVTYLTSRNATNDSYFVGNRTSPWYIVAYGMIGASLSGVTFISVPGAVGLSQFGYLQVIFGYLFGYTVIAFVLLPLYYRLHLTSIYSYLHDRFGLYSYKTGSFFFILSRVIGASFRLYIVVNVLQIFVFDNWHVPFWVTVSIFLILILLYTYEGGVKTIVWTDTLQTTFMLLSIVFSIIYISGELGYSLSSIPGKIFNSGYSKVFFTSWPEKTFFPKQFFGGMFIAIAMTGLDQEMMQKNISCKSLKDAQKNMMTFSVILLFVNLLFLTLGVFLYQYSAMKGMAIPAKTDNLFPVIALNYSGPVSVILFVIGLISAAYPSADGALTALTTAFCIDILGIPRREDLNEKKRKNIRYVVHISFAVLILLVIVVFRMINDEAVINKLFSVAGYTYGPLLGLYAFGLFSKKKVTDKWVPFNMPRASPFICYLLDINSKELFGGYKFGFELLILNGLITYIGLLLNGVVHHSLLIKRSR